MKDTSAKYACMYETRKATKKRGGATCGKIQAEDSVYCPHHKLISEYKNSQAPKEVGAYSR